MAPDAVARANIYAHAEVGDRGRRKSHTGKTFEFMGVNIIVMARVCRGVAAIGVHAILEQEQARAARASLGDCRENHLLVVPPALHAA